MMKDTLLDSSMVRSSNDLAWTFGDMESGAAEGHETGLTSLQTRRVK